MSTDPFGAFETINTPLGERRIARLSSVGDLEHVPYSIMVLLEAALRRLDGMTITEEDVRTVAAYDARNVPDTEIPFTPARVVLQDFTGVPAVVDLAAMRSAIVRMTSDPVSAKLVNPHVPPETGIVHQVNLEYLAKVVWDADGWLYPDSLVGTDSHTTMINGLGVVGWGVGGIEAEAVMVGQPIYMLLPEVVGFRLTGRLPEGATATDLVLTVTEMLREHGVVGKFVEFHGPGLADMPLANRATIANMAPEYGATIGFFPVDDQTLEYLRMTGRDEALVRTVEQYYKTQGLWRDDARSVVYSSTLELDLSTVEPSLAGPRRPQDRIALSAMKFQWRSDLTNLFGKDGGAAPSTI